MLLLDLVPIPPQTGQQPQNPIIRQIYRMQLGCQFINTATFSISIILTSAETEVQHMTPPRTQYPKPAIRAMPGITIKIVDERIIMNNQPCGATRYS